MRRPRLVRNAPKQTEPRAGSAGVLSCLVAYNEHGGYCIPRASAHRAAAQRVLAGDVWERETLDYLTAHVGAGDVIHAGAYFGDFLPALSAACPAGATIWAFEPILESFRCAAITALINDLANVRLTNAALGAREGAAVMLVRGERGRNLGGASRIVREAAGAEDGRTVSVRVAAVDEIVPRDRHVSLIHLDVEGHEREALTGAIETVRRCRPVLVLEAVPDDAWLAESVLALGYAVAGRTDTNTILSCTRAGEGSAGAAAAPRGMKRQDA